MPTTKDYYDILGVPKNSTDDQIKQAYRKLARENHPDMVKEGDKAAAEARFKEINEAYQVLSDTSKRKMYDQYGHAGGGFNNGQGAGNAGFGGQGGQWGPFSYNYSSTGAGGNPFGDIDPFDIFEEFFGFRGFGGGRAPKKGKDMHYEMDVTFADAVHGAEKTVKIGAEALTIKIPVGVRSGTQMKFAGKGQPGPNNVPAGDLYITMRVATPKEFERADDHLGVLITLNFAQATLGDVVTVPVVDPDSATGLGTAQLKIPAGTDYGARFKLKGKGMPQLRGNGRGDVIIQVAIATPKKLSKKQKELLEEYLATEN